MEETHLLTHEHGNMPYRCWGLGRPYLLLTCSPFGSAEFKELGETLSMSGKAVAPDLPGIAGADPLPDPTARALGDVLLSLFAQEGMDSMIVVAQGLATLPALELVTDHPAALSGLVLINPVLTPMGAARKPPFLTRGATAAIDILSLGQRKAVVALAKMLLDPKHMDGAAGDAARISLDRQGRRRMEALYNAVDPSRFPLYDEALLRFRKPVTLLNGEHDSQWAPGLGRRPGEGVPQARVRLIERAGHFVTLESSTEVADACLAVGREAW